MTLPGTVHVVAAGLALATGAAVLTARKGTARHRALGRLYAASMLGVNGAALMIYADSASFGPFHAMALLSLATLVAGLGPALLGRRGAADAVRHGIIMAWSYVGLVAAGVAQLTSHAVPGPGVLTVGLPAVLVCVAGGAWLHRRVPSAALPAASRRPTVPVAGLPCPPRA